MGSSRTKVMLRKAKQKKPKFTTAIANSANLTAIRGKATSCKTARVLLEVSKYNLSLRVHRRPAQREKAAKWQLLAKTMFYECPDIKTVTL